MKTYYSIISAQIRPEINEHLTIGLILIGDKESHLTISINKIEVIEKLLSFDRFYGLWDIVLGLTKMKNKEVKRVFAFDELKYLWMINNNIITYSKPAYIDVESTEENFKRLFSKYVDDKK